MADKLARVILSAACAGVLACAGLIARPAAAPTHISLEHPAALEFDILRKGSPIGHHVVRFTEDGPRLIVDIEIRILVTFASIPVYRYEHDSREVWQDGRLVALDTRTNDDGEAFRVMARGDGDRLLVDGSVGHLALPADVVPTSYWHRGLLADTNALETQRGKLAALHIVPRERDMIEVDGRTAAAQHYAVSGDLDMDLWYLPNGEWAKLAFTAKGAPIVYVRRTMSAAGKAP